MSKSNVYFILVEPKEGGNVGASARAIKNMGFGNLVLVRPCGYMTEESCRFAHGALDVLEGCAVYDDFNDAIRDKSIVIGISRRFGSKRGVRQPVAEGAKYAFGMAELNKVAVVFGREDNGLTNEEIKSCGLLLYIPSSEAQPSLNLAQAVMVTAYEIARQYNDSSASPASHKLITGEGLEYLYKRISKLLPLLGYGSRGSENLAGGIMRNIRRLVGRAGLTQWELNMLYGICTQIEGKIKGEL
ncbi:RNA methyltransferase [Candidatus Magnetominusculus xianensis]|uniref:tRNA (cytidine/uridine-2'-O-)-methyltransferase TrmJ n=1 Tax=Candidatus Magnetominusculus xianensis TaxID=1748249 RepID=A0ABR5SF76_9BACT|nr:RNA methyltransferase [Candidatus Magnetominusculus xianensis]KWT75604.1 RNA methyltransferase [Candidatus Magnetominusculus xianensis]MBF0403687.1 RNA methyltransferase [Nitrospirota bacterium]